MYITIIKWNLAPSLLYEVEENFKPENYNVYPSSSYLQVPSNPTSWKWKFSIYFDTAFAAINWTNNDFGGLSYSDLLVSSIYQYNIDRSIYV